MDGTSWLVLKLFIAILPIFMLYKAWIHAKVIRATQEEIEGESVLFVIAHPDDEAMFFVPTISNMKQKN